MSEQHPLVSVIIPVYNAEKFLQPCMDSILHQTLREIEVICVDDGSTDRSRVMLKKYAEEDARVILLTQENSGAGKARNTGLKAAKGETLSFLDADDFFELDMLEKAYQKLKAIRADFVVFDSDVYLMSQGKREKRPHIDKNILPLYEPFTFRAITGNVFRAFIGWAWDKLYDHEFIRKSGLTFQEQRTTNDMYFTFAALTMADRIGIIDMVLAHHRKEDQQSLSNTREKSWHCFHDALMALKEKLASLGLAYELEQDYVNYCLHSTLWNLESLTGEPQRLLYEKLQQEWLEEFGLLGHKEEYFDDRKDYEKLLRLKELTYDQYFHN